jgi:hypothetical protein
VTYAEPSLEDYADRRAEQLTWWDAQNGQQPGDPGKLGRALVTIAREEQPPPRFLAGADAIAEQKVADLQAAINAYRDLSTSLALEEREADRGAEERRTRNTWLNCLGSVTGLSDVRTPR